MTREQQSAFLDWQTQVTHALVELEISHTAKLNLLDSLRDVKCEFGVEDCAGVVE